MKWFDNNCGDDLVELFSWFQKRFRPPALLATSKIYESGNCHRILVGRPKLFWSQVNNSKTVRDRQCMCQWGANRYPWVAYPRPHVPPKPPNRGRDRKVSLSNCSQTVEDRRKCQDSTLENTMAGSEGMTWIINHTALAKAPRELTQIDHNMCGHRTARSPLWWWPCF